MSMHHESKANPSSEQMARRRMRKEQTFADVRASGLDRRVGLKERVRELESLVRQLVQKGGNEARKIESNQRRPQKHASKAGVLSPPESTSDRHGIDAQSPMDFSAEQIEETASDSYDSLDDLDSPHAAKSNFENAPFVSLFNNALLQHDRAEPGGRTPASALRSPLGNPGRMPKGRACKVLEDLRALIPPEQDLKIILTSISHLLPLWLSAIVEDHLAPGGSLDDALCALLQSNRPIHLCKAFVVLALMIQQRPPSKIGEEMRLSDGADAKDLVLRYLQTVEPLLLVGDNNLIGSIEGIECALLMSKFYTNDGQPRKAWLLFQRCLSEARMLGFHRVASWKTSPDPSLGQRCEKLWWTLYQGDRYLSLVLGLPHSVFDSHVGVDSVNFGESEALHSPANFATPASFALKLAAIAGHIIDRNQNPDAAAAMCYSDTMKIDGELHALSCSMPEWWWKFSFHSPDLSAFANLPVKEIYDMAHAQVWYHECRLALHMPFMMKNIHDRASQGRYSYSRQTALKSGRSLIRVHLHLRSRSDFASMVCQILDFQVFTATLLLVLDIISRAGNGTGFESWGSSDTESLRDRELIGAAMSMLKRLALENTSRNNVPAQAVKVLQTLANVFRCCESPGIDRQTRRIVIPYFGAITIKPSNCIPEGGDGEATALSGTTAVTIIGQQPQTSRLPNADKPWNPGTKAWHPQETPKTTSFHNYVTFDNYNAPQSLMTDVYPLAGGGDSQAISPEGGGPPPDPSFSALSINGENSTIDPMQDLNTSPTPIGELDASIWNDGVWQNMLQQDLSVDTEADWNWFPVEGVVPTLAYGEQVGG